MTMIVTTLLAAALATLVCPIGAREQMRNQRIMFPPPGGNGDCYGRLTKVRTIIFILISINFFLNYPRILVVSPPYSRTNIAVVGD